MQNHESPLGAKNPFATPQADVNAWPDPHAEEVIGNLASVGTRFIGSIGDNLFYLLCILPGIILAANNSEDAATALGGFGLLLGLGIQTYLITTSGQSVAKKLLKMRIVRPTGELPGFVHGVLLRSWVMALLASIPAIGSLVSLVDGAMILGDDRRCLHDRIADTIVVQVD